MHRSMSYSSIFHLGTLVTLKSFSSFFGSFGGVASALTFKPKEIILFRFTLGTALPWRCSQKTQGREKMAMIAIKRCHMEFNDRIPSFHSSQLVLPTESLLPPRGRSCLVCPLGQEWLLEVQFAEQGVQGLLGGVPVLFCKETPRLIPFFFLFHHLREGKIIWLHWKSG